MAIKAMTRNTVSEFNLKGRTKAPFSTGDRSISLSVTWVKPFMSPTSGWARPRRPFRPPRAVGNGRFRTGWGVPVAAGADANLKRHGLVTPATRTCRWGPRQKTGTRDQGPGSRKQGAENREQKTGSRKQGAENRDQKTKPGDCRAFVLGNGGDERGKSRRQKDCHFYQLEKRHGVATVASERDRVEFARSPRMAASMNPVNDVAVFPLGISLEVTQEIWDQAHNVLCLTVGGAQSLR
jgi:hypothetical protein